MCNLGGEASVIIGSHPEFPMTVRSQCRQEERRRIDIGHSIQVQGPTTDGSRRTCMFFKVQGVEGSKNPERRRTVHLQAGHVGIDRQFAD
jgi:hypothetical protein